MKTAHDLVAQAKAEIREVTLEQVDEAIREAAVVIDVREADEYASGHLPGAVHMSRGLLEFKISASPELAARDLSIVVYCKTSGRAALAAVQLRAMGYLNVLSIAGGFDAWVASGRQIVKPALPNFD